MLTFVAHQLHVLLEVSRTEILCCSGRGCLPSYLRQHFHCPATHTQASACTSCPSQMVPRCVTATSISWRITHRGCLPSSTLSWFPRYRWAQQRLLLVVGCLLLIGADGPAIFETVCLAHVSFHPSRFAADGLPLAAGDSAVFAPVCLAHVP